MTARRPLGVLLVVLVAASCGGKSESERAACYEDARADAIWRVTNDAYEAGRLGSRADVERQLAERNRPSFFDENGAILPLEEMDQQQKLAWSHWVNFANVQRETREERRDALQEAREDCDLD
jgi:hypothetical protein